MVVVGVLVAAGVVPGRRRAFPGTGALEVAQAVVELGADPHAVQRAVLAVDRPELEAGQLVDLPVGAAEVGADRGEAQRRQGRHVDVTAAGAVDPLPGAHRAPAVAGAAHLDRPAAAAAHVARRPQAHLAAGVLDVEVGGRADAQVGAEQDLCFGALAGVLADRCDRLRRRDAEQGRQQGRGRGRDGSASASRGAHL